MVGYGADRGIIPIVCENIFERMRANTDEDLTIKVTCSMLEIYMEKVKDLFNTGAGELKIRNNPKKGFYVENLTMNAVSDYKSINNVSSAMRTQRTQTADPRPSLARSRVYIYVSGLLLAAALYAPGARVLPYERSN